MKEHQGTKSQASRWSGNARGAFFLQTLVEDPQQVTRCPRKKDPPKVGFGFPLAALILQEGHHLKTWGRPCPSAQGYFCFPMKGSMINPKRSVSLVVPLGSQIAHERLESGSRNALEVNRGGVPAESGRSAAIMEMNADLERSFSLRQFVVEMVSSTEKLRPWKFEARVNLSWYILTPEVCYGDASRAPIRGPDSSRLGGHVHKRVGGWFPSKLVATCRELTCVLDFPSDVDWIVLSATPCHLSL